MIKFLIVNIVLISNLWAGFNFGECSGTGTFEQEIKDYRGAYENAVYVGEIPAGIEGLYVELVSEKDVDIRFYANNGDKIVHWPLGLLNTPNEDTKSYKNVALVSIIAVQKMKNCLLWSIM